VSQPGPLSERAIILAPHGRDGEIAVTILAAGGFPCELVKSVAELCAQIEKGAGLAIIADEALIRSDLARLSAILAGQPPWSDFPFIVMTRGGGAGPERNPIATRLANILGNVTFIERPFHSTTLLSVVRTAIRSRRRQYEARARLEELATERAALADLSRTLESRVAERTDQLRESENRLRAIFESSYQFQALLTPDGGVVDANPVSLKALNGQLADVLGKKFWDTAWFSHTPNMRETIRAAIEAVAAGGVVQKELLLNLPRGGWRWFDFAFRPLKDKSGAVIGIVPEASELTKRKQAEEALRRAQKMEALGQLTGGVAHDFNNLLSAVMGNLDLLRKHLPDDPRSHRLIAGALQGAQRGAALTQRMLAFARQQELKTDSVDLKLLILGMQELLDRTLGPQTSLSLDLADGPVFAQVDANQVELAILNLAINARDAMPLGGAIAICLDEPKDGFPLGLKPGRYLRIRIADSGSGMDEETLKKAVEPFFSTKAIGKGTGLGLSMVHGLAVQLGGALELSSAVGEGTTAALWLPMAEGAPVRTETEATATPGRSRPATVLLVDDDLLIAMSAAEMLQDLGHRVLEANSGPQALEIINSGVPIDLMMTDHAMPVMTGTELAELARLKRPGLPVLLATGYTDLPAGQKSDLPRLSKPYMQAQLKAEIDKLLAPS
jgi:PAS domain S-box-containing protein